VPVYKKVNKDFFKKWSPEMAYVLGFFAADGNIVKTKHNGFYLSFHSADKEILMSIKGAMKSEHKLSKRASSSGQVYRFQIGSKEMFEDLIILGLIPNKSKRMKAPKIPNKFSVDFIRGYFDGDGNVWEGLMNRKRKKPTKVLQAAFTSGSIEFLHGLHILLKKEGVLGGSLYKVKNKNCGRLLFSTLDALKLYEIMYNMPNKPHVYLKRKKLVFEKFIKMRS